jgi:hypothetical protein
MPERRERYLELRAGSDVLRARLLTDRAPTLAPQLYARLPLRLEVIQDEWSGWIFRSRSSLKSLRIGPRDETPPYQHPGLLLVEKQSRRIAVCYGQARLQDGFGPLTAVPIAQIGGDLAALARLGKRLEYEGVQTIVLARAANQRSPLEEEPVEAGRDIEVQLGAARGVARLLEASAPITTASFLAALPIVGTGTNIPLNGPLVRLRTPSDSDADETKIESDAKEARHTILYPGHVYYRASYPAGIRMTTRDATSMHGRGGVTTMSTIPFVPVARLTGDWSALRAEAARLFLDGQKPFSFRRLDDEARAAPPRSGAAKANARTAP